jgi:hypothetical protein
MIKICIGFHEKYPLFLSDFHENLNFLDRFMKKYSNILKILSLEPCGQTDAQKTKLIDAFRNFFESA